MLLGWKAMTNLDSILKTRDITADKGTYVQSYGFSSSHVKMWELDHKEGWVPKNWCFQTVGLEKILESPLLCKEIKPINAKGNQCWIFIGRMILKLKLQSFGHLMWRADSMEKTLTLGKAEGRSRKGRQNKVVGWHHQLDRHESEQAPGVGNAQGSLACFSPWGHKESDTTKWLNWLTEMVKICRKRHSQTVGRSKQ